MEGDKAEEARKKIARVANKVLRAKTAAKESKSTALDDVSDEVDSQDETPSAHGSDSASE